MENITHMQRGRRVKVNKYNNLQFNFKVFLKEILYVHDYMYLCQAHLIYKTEEMFVIDQFPGNWKVADIE